MKLSSFANIRIEYNLASLRRADIAADPLVQFEKWFGEAAGATRQGRIRSFFVQCYKALCMARGIDLAQPNVTSLATADKNGCPSVRIVLLKGIDERGFIFFTNYESRKAHNLTENPQAALAFYWPGQERQVCITGVVTKLSREESEAYFKNRPKGSRLSAWASRQSEILENRAVLEKRWNELEKQHSGSDVPMPPWWGGYVLSPLSTEFWQGRPGRLHDRFRYVKQPDQSWRIDRLAP